MASTTHDVLEVVTREQLRALLSDPAVRVVDVLAEESYARAHIPGAINVPVSRLDELAALKLPDRAARIVTYCAGFL